MKETLSILLAFTITLPMLLKSYLLIDFQLHRLEIEEAYCVNKDNPELECHGSCHISKEIKKIEIQDEQENEKRAPFTPTSQNKNETYFASFHLLKASIKALKEHKQITPISDSSYHFIYYVDIFHPPQFC